VLRETLHTKIRLSEPERSGLLTRQLHDTLRLTTCSPTPSQPHNRPYVKKEIKVSDILAGAVGALVVLPELIDQRNGIEERLAVVLALAIGMVISWHYARKYHWIIKTALFAGICMGCVIVAQLIVYALR